jgi:hypothetical protein
MDAGRSPIMVTPHPRRTKTDPIPIPIPAESAAWLSRTPDRSEPTGFSTGRSGESGLPC